MTLSDAPTRSRFGGFVARNRAQGQLVVQPRMGFGNPQEMRRGLDAVRAANLPAIGTITLDSYTRQNDHDRAAMARESGIDLNGYALVAMGAEQTTRMLDGVATDDFPVQVRHGSPLPEQIFETMLNAGVTASEGGPVSYCLPYSRVPLRESTAAWVRATRLLARTKITHLESFGGCMLGQLCPPSLLVALSVLECAFFIENGVTSVSASYAQQTSPTQDAEALRALRALCAEHLGGADWHVVLYTYMGLFPQSADGARELLRESARLAARTGTERLIVKTVAEAHRIPTIEENVEALRTAHRTAAATAPDSRAGHGTEVYEQASTLIDTVRELAPTLAEALPLAFEGGLLDVPYCLHPDNRNEARCVLGRDGRLEWRDTGRLPVRARPSAAARNRDLTYRGLIEDLEYHRRRLDLTTRS